MKLENIHSAIIVCNTESERDVVAGILNSHKIQHALDGKMEPFAHSPNITINSNPRCWCDCHAGTHYVVDTWISAADFIKANAKVHLSAKLENIKDAVIVCETWSDREVVIRTLLSSDVPVGYHEDMPATYFNHPNVCISEYPRSWTTLPSQVAYKNAPFIPASEFISENKDIENRVRNGNSAVSPKVVGMTPIVKKEDPNAILTSDIDPHKHLIVAIHNGFPCIVNKGHNEAEEGYSLKVVSKGFTKGDSYFHRPLNYPRTIGGLVEEVIEKTKGKTSIAVFEYADWRPALQWLIDNA